MESICLLCKESTKDETDIIVCVLCNQSFHSIKCCNLSRSQVRTYQEVPNFRYFCDNCNATEIHISTMISNKLDVVNNSNVGNITNKLDEISNSILAFDCYSKLAEKLTTLSNEVTELKTSISGSAGVKRKRTGSFRLNVPNQASYSQMVTDQSDDNESPNPTRFKPNTGSAIVGTDEEDTSEIRIIEKCDFFHVSQFEPNVDIEKVKAWKEKLKTDDFKCTKLIPRNRSLEDLSFVSIKLGVPKSAVQIVMNPKTWPKSLTVRPFQQRNGIPTPRLFRF